MSEVVQVAREGGVAIVTLNRPEARNSLGVDQMQEVGAAFAQAARDGARCVLVRGAGPAFCAGRDLKDAKPGEEETHAILAERINPALAQVRACPVPTIAAVHGPALGFGFGLALACDITLVADDALLGSPFRNIGLTLDSGGHYYLRERVGRHRAAEIIMTGRLFSGREAAQMGLVNRSIGASDLHAQALALAGDIAAGPTAAFRASKEILSYDFDYDEVAALEAEHQARLMQSADAREGIAAFIGKRKPRFTGH
jgi:2-(1,2-epoxy-1,2-dihydrophenyl)acetyl-CoA isomerase